MEGEIIGSMRLGPRSALLLAAATFAVGAAPARAGDPVIAAAGDIACGPAETGAFPCQQQATSDLLFVIHPDAVLALVRVTCEGAEPEQYLLPLSMSFLPAAEALVAAAPWSVLCGVIRGEEAGILHDGLADDATCVALLGCIESEARLITGPNAPLRSFYALQILKTLTSLRACWSHLYLGRNELSKGQQRSHLFH